MGSRLGANGGPHVRTKLLVAVVVLVTASTSAAFAQETSGWGVRFGLSDDPDQVVVGAQYDVGEVARHVHIVPNLELGLGDDVTLVTLAAIAQYRFGTVDRMRPYAGGGIEAGWIDVDDGPGDDDSDFEIQLDVVGGLAWPMSNGNEFFLELVLGFGDLQDAQIMAGFSF